MLNAAIPLIRSEPVALNRSLTDQVRDLNAQYRRASAQDILRAAIAATSTGKLALVSSFGAEAAALLSIVAEVDPTLPVIFLDTGKHFYQTLQYRDDLVKFFGLKTLISLSPNTEDLEAADPNGRLHRTNADACCHIRKTVPLDQAMMGYDAWVTGRKRFHGGERLALPVFERMGDKVKVNPLANWSAQDVAERLTAINAPRHPMVELGYPSIGCWPCTKPNVAFTKAPPLPTGMGFRLGVLAQARPVSLRLSNPGSALALAIHRIRCGALAN